MEVTAVFQRHLVAKIWIVVLCQVWVGVALAKPPPVVAELVANAKAAVKTIDMKAFRVLLDQSDHGFIIDVREPDEFATDHVPGAVNIPRGVIEFRIWALIDYPKNRRDKASREEVAHKVAWAAVKHSYEKHGDKWVKKKTDE